MRRLAIWFEIGGSLHTIHYGVPEGATVEVDEESEFLNVFKGAEEDDPIIASWRGVDRLGWALVDEGVA